MNRRGAIIAIFVAALSLGSSSNAQTPTPSAVPPQSPSIIEHGKFILHKFEQPIGEETFETTRDGQSLSTKIDFKFVDRGNAVPLTVTFRTADDLTPESFKSKVRPHAPPKSTRPSKSNLTKSASAIVTSGQKSRAPNNFSPSLDTPPPRCKC